MIFFRTENGSEKESMLYRLVDLEKRDIGEGEYYTIETLLPDGNYYQGWETKETLQEWKFYTGNTAKLLTIIFGSRYESSPTVHVPDDNILENKIRIALCKI